MELTRTSTAVSCRGLSAGYDDKTVLRDITLDIDSGSIAALAGPNGSGKTTLLRVLTGSLAPRSGVVELLGRPLTSYPAAERALKVAFVPQTVQVTMPFTVREIVALGRLPHLKPWQRIGVQDEAAMASAMAATDISAYRDVVFTKLSAGEQQRTLLAMALAQQPELLILDEPTSHLDVKHAWTLMAQIREQARQRRLTVLFSTHDLNVAAAFASHVVLLRQGRVFSSGTPGDTFTASTLGKLFDHPMEVIAAQDRPFIRPGL